MENKATIKTAIPTPSGFRNFALCTLIFAFSTYLSCHEFIVTEPPFLSMDYFSVFSAFSVAISFVPSCLSGYKSIMQNKPNFKMGNINISTVTTKAYAKEQRTMNNERYSKQTQSNPIPPPPPAPGKNPESRSETHIPIYRASIKDRESSIENQASSPFCRAFMASLRKTKPMSKWAI
jgi:hypothetical protein